MPHKKYIFFLLFICLVLIGVYWYITTRPTPDISVIVLKETGFEPQNISIKKGSQIEFKTERNQPFWPASDLHPTHGIYPEFDPQEGIDPSQSWSFTFDKKGTWKYHDHLNPFFRGTITVE